LYPSVISSEPIGRKSIATGQNSLVPYFRNTAIKNKKLRNVFLNYVVTYTTKVLIPFKLVMKKGAGFLPFAGVSSLRKTLLILHLKILGNILSFH